MFTTVGDNSIDAAFSPDSSKNNPPAVVEASIVVVAVSYSLLLRVKVATKFFASPGVMSTEPVPATTSNFVDTTVLSVVSLAAVNLTVTLDSGIHASNFN